jgi:hypothetical protein
MDRTKLPSGTDMQIETLRIQANESGEAILQVPLLLL